MHFNIVNFSNDGSSFGMLQPNRTYNSGEYRFGFQNQENDNETKGIGNSICYTQRLEDTRLCRFISNDPLYKEYPQYSPYHFSSNQPIHAPELEGKESAWDLNSRDPNFKLLDEKGKQRLLDIQGSFGLFFVNGIIEIGAAKSAYYLYNAYKTFKTVSYIAKAEEIILETGQKVWSMAPSPRGLAIEKALGGNLPKNFPTIDKFINGTAESIKSIDLGAKTYQKTSALEGTIKGYIDDLAEFKGATFDGKEIVENQVKNKVLTIAIEKGKGSEAQSTIFEKMVQYAKENSVQLVTKTVK